MFIERTCWLIEFSLIYTKIKTTDKEKEGDGNWMSVSLKGWKFKFERDCGKNK